MSGKVWSISGLVRAVRMSSGLEISIRQARHWTDLGILQPIDHTVPGGHARYAAEAVARAATIACLLEAGLTVQQIHKLGPELWAAVREHGAVLRHCGEPAEEIIRK